MHYKSKGLTHLYRATLYSLQGLKSALHETAFRHELMACVVLVPLAFVLGKSRVEIALLLLVLLLVLVVELLNSAIEAVVDRVGLEHHPLSGKAKDLGSAAVMVSMLTAVVVWVVLLF